MAVIPIGMAQVNLVYAGSGVPRGAQNTFGLYIAEYVGNLQAVADQVALTWAARLKPALPNTIILGSVRVKAGPNATGPEAIKEVNQACNRSTDVDSPNVAYLVRKQTASGGRANRGRFFVPGVAEGGTNAGGFLQTGEQTTQQTAWTGFKTDLGSAGLPMTLLHTNPDLAPTAITSLEVQNLVATQRRRLRKVGGRRRTGG